MPAVFSGAAMGRAVAARGHPSSASLSAHDDRFSTFRQLCGHLALGWANQGSRFVAAYN